MTSIDGSSILETEDGITDRAIRKAVVRLVPILTLAFVLNYLDRTNIGFAALTMNRDIGLSDGAFGWGAGILFFGYCAFEIPSTWAMDKVGARLWLTRIMLTWGVLSAATALAIGPKSFYGLRFLLGIAEAGFVPGAMFFFATWFPASHRTRILAWFQMSVPVAALISGPLSSGVLSLDGAFGFAGWQWLFLVEGLPSIALAGLLVVIIADTPARAAWLTVDERHAIERAVSAEVRERPIHGFWAALADARVLMLAAIQFGFTMGSYGIAVWLPLILRGHALSTSAVGWLAAVPPLCGCVATVIWSGHVDRTGQRTRNLATACLIGASGLVISVAFDSLGVSLAGISIALIGITSARGIFWAIPPRFLTGSAAAGGLAFINSVGTLGGFFGPVAIGWLKEETGSFGAGLLVMAGLMATSSALTVLFGFLFKSERGQQ